MAQINSTTVTGVITQTDPATAPNHLVRLSEAQALGAVGSVNGQTGVVVLNTSHLAENTNLFYTDARVRACVLTGFSATTGAITAADTVLTALNKTQGRLAALEAGSVTSVNGQSGVVVLNTSHLTESGNLFYTDTRVRSCVLTGFSAATGAITASDTVLTAFNKTQGRLAVIEAWTTTNLSEGSNLYYTDARVRACVLTGFSATTGAITAADTVLTGFNKTQGRLAALEAAAVLSVNGQIGAVVLNTSHVAENTNLYHTDARVRGCVLTGFSSTTGAITASDTVLTAFNKTQGRLAVIEAWTTTSLAEGSNLYYTDARVRACVLTGFSATTGAITASDTVLTGFNKTQGRLAVLEAAISGSVLTGTGVLITDRVTTSLLEIADATSSASISMSGVDKISVFAGTFTMDVDLVTMFSGTLGADWFQSGSAVGTSFIQPSLTSGSPTILTVTGGAHTSLASTAEATDIRFNLNRVVQFATGALSTQRAVRIDAPQYAFVAASTLTNASTVEISGAPSAWTNATVTTAAGLRIKNGGLAAGNTNGYGLYCEAPTGATNNFAALFAGSVVIGGTPSMGGGVGVVFLANASTNPSSNPTGGGLLYVDAGALKYRGSGGTVTTVGVA